MIFQIILFVLFLILAFVAKRANSKKLRDLMEICLIVQFLLIVNEILSII